MGLVVSPATNARYVPRYQIAPLMTIAINLSGLSGIAIGISGLALLLAVRRLAGTTLVAAAGWACAAALTLAITCRQGGQQSPEQFLAATLIFGPIVAVLGAKRPQHHAWQFIVVTLLAILMMPAGEAIVFGQVLVPELHAARQGLMLGLVAIGLANYLPTRYGAAAAVIAVAQLFLLAPFMSWLDVFAVDDAPTYGRLLFALAVGTVWLSTYGVKKNSHPLDGPWFAFRNAYGVLWGLRVAERFNATAHANGWHVELSWQGAQPKQWPIGSAEKDLTIVRCLDALLRRFVSREWINAQSTIKIDDETRED